MPVHRLNTGTGESVYAQPDEIDAWMARQSRTALVSTEADSHVPGNGHGHVETRGGATITLESAPGAAGARRTRPLRAFALTGAAGMAVAVLVAAASIAWLWLAPSPGGGLFARRVPPSGPQPAALTFAGNALTCHDAGGHALWSATFEHPLTDLTLEPRDVGRRSWGVWDLDGDGRNEVVLARRHPQDPTLYGFDSDGTPRFRHQVRREVRFGEYACPPVYFTHVFQEQRPDFRGTFFVIGQHPLHFPAVLQRLDSEGRVRGEYWSNGYLTSLTSVTFGDRPVTFVGGASNEIGGAALAVFFGNIGGSAPAREGRYRCEGCPPGGPDIFLVFPRSRLQAALNHNAFVSTIVQVGADRVVVAVQNAGISTPNEPCCGVAYYTLDADFNIVGTELGPDVASTHRQYEVMGKAGPGTRFRDPDDFYPVLRWNGAGFDSITDTSGYPR